MRSHSRVPVAVVVAGVSMLLAAPGSAQVAGLSAPGQPYVDCTQAATRYERLSSGLEVQREAIRREEALLDALREERTAGTKEARDQLMARSVDSLRSHAAEELEAMKKAREKALELAPDPSDAARLKWMKQVSILDESVSRLKAAVDAFQAGHAYGAEIQRRSHTVLEHLREANKLFVESGLAEAIGGDLAKAGGPAGVALFEGTLALLDHLVSDQGQWDRLLEEQWAAANLDAMRRALGDVEEKMANLAKDCPAQLGQDAGTQSPPAASVSLTPPPPEPPSAEPPAASAAKKSGGSGGKAAVVVLGAGVAVGGALLAGAALGDLATTMAGSCVSNRFCIVSVMSSGCSCSGSVNGSCGWTGAAAGSGEGCGSGVPCAANLSCNNGRCEGPSGRCPF